MRNYYFVRNFPIPNQAEIEVCDGPSWGIGAHYRTNEELEIFGNGPFEPSRIKYQWKMLDVSVKPNFVGVDPGVLTTTVGMYEDFKKTVAPYVLEYHITISKDPYVSFRPRFFKDLMDREKSTFRLSVSGDLIMPKEIILTQAPERDLPIFGLEFEGKAKPFILVSESFKAIYEKSTCSGLKFQAAWKA